MIDNDITHTSNGKIYSTAQPHFSQHHRKRRDGKYCDATAVRDALGPTAASSTVGVALLELVGASATMTASRDVAPKCVAPSTGVDGRLK